MEKNILQQTKNKFQMQGVVTRIDKDYAYKEDVMKKGKHEGDKYRSLGFGIKTSESNENFIGMFSYEPEKVFLWNSDKRAKDSTYKGDRVPYEQWLKNKDKYRENGYSVLQTRIGVVKGDDGKVEKHGLPSYEAIKEIYDNIDNGDTIYVEGTIRYSEYKDKNGKNVKKKTFSIEKLFITDSFDFKSDKFEETAYFEQDMMFVDADFDKSDGNLYVTGRHINYNNTWNDTDFVVRCIKEDGEEDVGIKKLATYLEKKVKFGDMIELFGKPLNKVVIEKVEEDSDDDDDILAGLGYGKPKYAQGNTAKTFINEFSVYGISKHDKKVYTEDDFIEDSLIEEDVLKEDDELEDLINGGGKEKFNPFNSKDKGESVPVDDSFDEDDLPF